MKYVLELQDTDDLTTICYAALYAATNWEKFPDFMGRAGTPAGYREMRELTPHDVRIAVEKFGLVAQLAATLDAMDTDRTHDE